MKHKNKKNENQLLVNLCINECVYWIKRIDANIVDFKKIVPKNNSEERMDEFNKYRERVINDYLSTKKILHDALSRIALVKSNDAAKKIYKELNMDYIIDDFIASWSSLCCMAAC